jgi:hypothetical protein
VVSKRPLNSPLFCHPFDPEGVASASLPKKGALQRALFCNGKTTAPMQLSFGEYLPLII